MKQVEEKGSEWSSSGEEKSEERREKEKQGSTSGEKMSKNEEKEKEGSTSGEKTSAGKKKYVRAKHKCPFPSCKSLVYHLPRLWWPSSISKILCTFCIVNIIITLLLI
jgi:hypothetical protein